MGLSSAIVPQGIRKACTAWQPLYCKSTTVLVATWSVRLMQNSASIEVHSCTTMKMEHFQNAISAFYAALTAGRRPHSRLSSFPGALPTLRTLQRWNLPIHPPVLGIWSGTFTT